MKNNSPRKKNISKKRNTSKKKSYPEANRITENKTTQNTSKKKYYKKKKNKVTFKEYIREIVEYVWDDRVTIIFCVGFLAALGFLYFTTHYNPNNDSEICTVESVEIIEHEDPYSISGEFETEECGIITMWHAPDGERIYPYLQNFKTGKKYRAYKSFDSRNDEFDFTVIRFEEIKE